MKIVHMGVNNPHLKPKPGGYFAQPSPAPPLPASSAAVRTIMEPHPPGLMSRSDSKMAQPTTATASQLAVSVEDVLLMDDSPTAELIPCRDHHHRNPDEEKKNM